VTLLLRAVPETGEYEVAEAPPASGMQRFRSDGASIPRVLWAALGSPFDPRLVEAAIYHDFDYQMGEPRDEADERFRVWLVAAGVGTLRAFLLWLGVRALGWRYWRTCRLARGIGGRDADV